MLSAELHNSELHESGHHSSEPDDTDMEHETIVELAVSLDNNCDITDDIDKTTEQQHNFEFCIVGNELHPT